jgi:hypothetical protein
MRTISALSALIAGLGMLLAPAVLAQVPDPRITVADVEAVAKLPVHVVAAGRAVGAGPGVNFATADEKMLLMVVFGDSALYERAKAQKEMKMGNTTLPMVLFHAAVPGIGDEAFDSPPGAVQYVIYLRKGPKAASVTTYFERNGKTTRLTIDQVKAIAKTVAGRM